MFTRAYRDRTQIKPKTYPPQVERRWRWAALILGGIILSIGCNPATLGFLMFMNDPYFPPEFSFTETKRNPKVLILASHARAEIRDYLMQADEELANCLNKTLSKRYKERRLRVEIIPSYKVVELRNKYPQEWKIKSPVEIGKEMKADYVVNLEINKIRLYKPGSYHHHRLYQANSEVDVSVFDVNANEGQGAVFTKNYLCTYPDNPIPADDRSEHIFRNAFINRMAQDLARIFAPYTTEEKLHLD